MTFSIIVISFLYPHKRYITMERLFNINTYEQDWEKFYRDQPDRVDIFLAGILKTFHKDIVLELVGIALSLLDPKVQEDRYSASQIVEAYKSLGFDDIFEEMLEDPQVEPEEDHPCYNAYQFLKV